MRSQDADRAGSARQPHMLLPRLAQRVITVRMLAAATAAREPNTQRSDLSSLSSLAKPAALLAAGLYTTISIVLIIVWWQRGDNYGPDNVSNIAGFYNFWVQHSDLFVRPPDEQC